MRSSALALIALSAPAFSQTTGLTPLNDLGTGLYMGFQGGLYPGGQNAPPAAHATAAAAMAAQVVLRNAAGNPDPVAGKIAMISIGMSNTNQEWSVFERTEDANAGRNARVVILNGGVGGQDATVLANPTSQYWTIVTDRVTALGLTPAQVQVAWLKEAIQNTPNNFPTHAQQLRDDLRAIAQNLHVLFPNMKLCYLSSRIYGGYACIGCPTGNGEPQSYESGFSAKWLIEDQINGDPLLNYDPANGTVQAPLLLWGPYLWADGTNPRSDGLTWVSGDIESDHIHPAPSGEQKVAGLLSQHFASDPYAPWYGPVAGVTLLTVNANADSYVSAANPSTTYGALVGLLAQGGTAPVMNTYLRFDKGAQQAIFAKLSLRVPTADLGGPATLGLVANTSWNEATIDFANAPPIGSTIGNVPGASRDGTIAIDVTGSINADADGILCYALSSQANQPITWASKEAPQNDPPRLTLVVATSTPTGDDSIAGEGAGPSNANRVRVYDSAGVATAVDFLAYGASAWGVRVASGDIDGGSSAEIVTGPGPGAVFGPQVRGFLRDGTAMGKVNFYAYGTLKYGVNPASANVDGDAYDEILSGAGPGAVFGPHVRGWNFDGSALSAIVKISFYAYGTLKYGVNVAAGSVDVDAYAEILTGAGPSSVFAPTVRGFNYDASAVSSLAKINFNAYTAAGFGVNVSSGNPDGDAFAEIVTAPGPGASFLARFLGWNFDGSSIAAMTGFDVTPLSTFYGGRAGLSDLTGTGQDALLTGAGPDPSADSTVKPYGYNGSALTLLAGTYVPFAPSTYGVGVSGGKLGY